MNAAEPAIDDQTTTLTNTPTVPATPVASLPARPLTSVESDLLHGCESQIEAAARDVLSTGTSLLTIKAKRLYRHGHLTFESYCRSRWGMSRCYAYRLIAGAQVIAILAAECAELERPYREAQVRPLVGLHPKAIAEIWQRCITAARGGRITSRLVRSMVLGWSAASSLCSDSGKPIPKRAAAAQQKSDDLLSAVYKTKLLVERGYMGEALRALSLVENALEQLPGRCLNCYREPPPAP
jgi:hypothetical protein